MGSTIPSGAGAARIGAKIGAGHPNGYAVGNYLGFAAAYMMKALLGQ